MSKISITSEAIESRKKVLKKIQQRKVEIENLANLILNVFKASDIDADMHGILSLLVWNVRIRMNKKGYVECLVNFGKKDEKFYDLESVKELPVLKDMKNLIYAINAIEKVKITKEVYDSLYGYFYNVPEYFVYQHENDAIIGITISD